jgi:hypothetical protein
MAGGVPFGAPVASVTPQIPSNRHSSSTRIAIAISLAIVSCLVQVTMAMAATIPVTPGSADVLDNDDGNCTLREAVIAANTDTASGVVAGECAAGSGPGDNVNVPAGTFNLTLNDPSVMGDDGTSSGQENNSAEGDLDLLDQTRIDGAGPDLTTINQTVGQGGRHGERVIHVPDDDPTGTVLSGVSITGGALFGGIVDSKSGDDIEDIEETGAGLLLASGTPDLDNVRIADNHIYEGTGLSKGAGVAVVLISDHVDGSADQAGTVPNDAVSFTDVSIVDNGQADDAIAHSGGQGGGLWADLAAPADLSLTRVHIAGNEAQSSLGFTEGGGAYLNSHASLDRVVIEDNSVASNLLARGGGLYLGPGGAELEDSTISSNEANAGFGDLGDGTAEADAGGGGVYSEGDSTLTNVTIAGNSAVSDVCNAPGDMGACSYNGSFGVYSDAARALGGGFAAEGSSELRFVTLSDNTATAIFSLPPGPPRAARVGNPDGDGDGVPDASDNCPDTPNPGQEDIDGNTVGDACDPGTPVATDGGPSPDAAAVIGSSGEVGWRASAIEGADPADACGKGVFFWGGGGTPTGAFTTLGQNAGAGTTCELTDSAGGDEQGLPAGGLDLGDLIDNTGGAAAYQAGASGFEAPITTRSPNAASTLVSHSDCTLRGGVADRVAGGGGGTPLGFDARGATRPMGDACEAGAHERTGGGTDSDGDGVIDESDNCPDAPNSSQADFDGDSQGDACDPDDDNDTVADTTESGCPGGGVPTDIDSDDDGTLDGPDAFPCDPTETTDSDSDTVGDNDDNCPATANVGQADGDRDGDGDACDPDDDNDTVADTTESGCPGGGVATDDDSDDDGTLDGPDEFPCDAAETTDADSDTVGDNADQCDETAGPASNQGCPLPAAAGAKAESCRGRPTTVAGTNGDDALKGTAGRDVIQALGGDDEIRGLGGKDLLCGAGGDDVIRGGSGRDTLIGGPASDLLLGGKGRDKIFGGSPDAPDVLTPGVADSCPTAQLDQRHGCLLG